MITSTNLIYLTSKGFKRDFPTITKHSSNLKHSGNWYLEQDSQLIVITPKTTGLKVEISEYVGEVDGTRYTDFLLSELVTNETLQDFLNLLL